MTQLAKEQHPIIQILRWALFLPAALLGGLLVGALFNLIAGFAEFFAGTGGDGSFSQAVRFYFISAIISGAGAVIIGTEIAPSEKKIVAIILGIIVVMFSIVLMALSISGAVDFDWWDIVADVGFLFGAGGGIAYVLDERT